MYNRTMTIYIQLDSRHEPEPYDVEMLVAELDLTNRNSLEGRFRKFDPTDIKVTDKWNNLRSAMVAGSAMVTVTSRTYKLTSLDHEGNFTLEPDLPKRPSFS